ncbi:hypothetical protein JH314_08260 [Xanthomonas campestris]|uniref:hypothetical protein n=1 Tax=Xanthomonas campestris TaxID=339 RepID=UPI002367A887|nr:hypothetical protein [Xanthomonas campestris]WDJ03383.1 hypothetical protein JH314_08260 [Xanthomonas campestris]
MKDIEQRARDLLAAEVDLDAVLMPESKGAKEVADSIRDGGDGNIPFVATALRAIIAALSQQQGAPHGLLPPLAEAARDALPFVAYAYSKGVAGAEDAGRAIETALGGMPEQQGEGAYHQALQQIGYALGLPAGSDLTTQCIPAIEAMRRDVERLNLGAIILSHRADEWGNTRTEFTGRDLRQAIDDAARSRARAEVQHG